jgi:hypothetical protein
VEAGRYDVDDPLPDRGWQVWRAADNRSVGLGTECEEQKPIQSTAK